MSQEEAKLEFVKVAKLILSEEVGANLWLKLWLKNILYIYFIR